MTCDDLQLKNVLVKIVEEKINQSIKNSDPEAKPKIIFTSGPFLIHGGINIQAYKCIVIYQKGFIIIIQRLPKACSLMIEWV